MDNVGGTAAATTFLAVLDNQYPDSVATPPTPLPCEACKDEPLNVDMVAPLRRFFASDPNPKVRFEALRALVGRLDAAAEETALGMRSVSGPFRP